MHLSPLPTSPISAAFQPVGMMSDRNSTFSSGRSLGTFSVLMSAARRAHTPSAASLVLWATQQGAFLPATRLSLACMLAHYY